MLIAILSDSHDNEPQLQSAIDHANQAGAQHLLFAGDLIAPPCVDILARFKGQVDMVLGNNEAELLGLQSKISQHDHLILHNPNYQGNIDGKRVFMDHYPINAENAAQSGNYDLAIHGHTHHLRQEQFDNCTLVNPGEIQGLRTGQSTYLLWDTTDNTFQTIRL